MSLYEIVHHIPGRIRLRVPSLKGLSIKDLKRVAEKLSGIPLPSAIKDIRINPLNYNLVIKYDPEKIDILKFLEDITSSKEMQEVLEIIRKK